MLQFFVIQCAFFDIILKYNFLAIVVVGRGICSLDWNEVKPESLEIPWHARHCRSICSQTL
jgi:hypothetical protein